MLDFFDKSIYNHNPLFLISSPMKNLLDLPDGESVQRTKDLLTLEWGEGERPVLSVTLEGFGDLRFGVGIGNRDKLLPMEAVLGTWRTDPRIRNILLSDRLRVTKTLKEYGMLRIHLAPETGGNKQGVINQDGGL